MNKWTLKSLAAVAVGLLAFAGQVSAAVSYSYTTDATNYNAAPGDVVNVKLYLLETLSGGSGSVITQDGGLFGFGVQAARTTGNALITNYAGNDTDFPTFPNPKPTVPAGGVSTYKFSQGISPSAATGVNPGNGGANALSGGVYLGSIAITAGSANSSFNVIPYSAGGGNTLTNTNFYDLDFNSANPAFTGASSANPPSSFTISVPEPTFAGIAMVVGAASTLIRRRRQQA